jgi:hypothetical protein
MKLKKLIAGLLSAAILSFSSIMTFAADQDPIKFINMTTQVQPAVPINEVMNPINQVYFNSFTGVVKEISDFSGIKGAKFVSVLSTSGDPANIIISEDTYILNDAELKIGDVITAYYDANAPMIMIYPAQYNALVVVVNDDTFNVKVDVFDKDLISSDGMLKLNISKDTKILSQDREVFNGELTDRALVVVYDTSTKSIPAQTTPSQIVVLFEKPETLPSPVPDKPASEASTFEVLVNDKTITSLPAYRNAQNTVMVPLRQTAEAMKYTVAWDEQLKEVLIGKDISLTLNKDNYHITQTAPVQLGTAPTLIRNTTFVPLSFFEEVMNLDHVTLTDSQVILNAK